MTLYEELTRRGLIAQVTDEKEISEMINNGKATSTSASTPLPTAFTLVTSWLCAL